MPTMKDFFVALLFSPNVCIVQGYPGSGKSFLAMILAAWVVTQPHGYAIANVKIQKWDAEKNRPVETTVPKYLLAHSFVGILDAIAEILYSDPEAHIVVFIDELQNSLGSADWQGGLAKGFKKWLGLLRKFHVSFVGSTPRLDWLLNVLRDEEVGLLSVQVLKDPLDLDKYAGAWMDEWDCDYKHTAVIHWPAQGIFHRPVHVGPAPILAIPEDLAKESGAPYFDTGGVASLEYGKHPLTGKPVDFGQVLALLDQENVVSYDYPRVLYEYFRRPAQDMEKGPLRPKLVATHVTQSPENRAPTQHGIVGRVDEMIKAGANYTDVHESTNCSEAFFYRRKKILRAAGEAA